MSGKSSECLDFLPDAWCVERRADGALLVRIPSRRDSESPLPDAVFTFRSGDPQYSFWEQQLARAQRNP